MKKVIKIDQESYDRYNQWLQWYFDNAEYDTSEVSKFIERNTPWLPSGRKKELVRDWENFILESKVQPELEGVREGIGQKSPRFWAKVRRFLGRLFGSRER